MPLIDCQMATPHLASLGARRVPRRLFTAWVDALVRQPGPADWRFAPTSRPRRQAGARLDRPGI